MLALPAAGASAAVPADFVGVVSSKHDAFTPSRRAETLDLQAEVGVGLLRVPFDWSRIEPMPGWFDFSVYDELVGDAARRHIRLLPILFDPPPFRSSAPPSGGLDAMYPPREPEKMGWFAAELVQRYGPDGSFWSERPEVPRLPIRSWQVWNEPNIPSFWASGPDPAEYAELLRTVGEWIHAVDPGAEVVAAGLPNSAHGASAPSFLRAMYKAGAKGSFDTLAVHPYSSDHDSVMGQVQGMRSVADDNGDRAPIWVTELGWPTDGPPGYEQVVSEEEQARLVTRTLGAFAAERGALGLRGFVYFYWRESARDPHSKTPDSIWGHVGLIAPDRRKPAFYAFADAVARMRERDVTVTPDDPPTTPGDPPGAPVPRVKRVDVAPGRFVAARNGKQVRRDPKCAKRGGRPKRGGCLAFRLDRGGAIVLVRIERLGGRRPVVVGSSVRVDGAPGSNRLWLSGVVRGTRLRPGLYRVVLTPLDANAAPAAPASRRFRVVRDRASERAPRRT